MVRKPLPRKTLDEVRATLFKTKVIPSRVSFEKNKHAKRFFLKLKSADYREPDSASHRWLTSQPGFSVRKIKTKRGEVILKIPEFRSALREIRSIRRGVSLINSYPHRGFILLAPHAHAIGNFIVMKKTRFPSLFEMRGGGMPDKGYVPPTKRGKLMLEKIARQSGMSEKEALRKIQKAHATLERKAEQILLKQSENNGRGFYLETYEPRNLLVLGIKNNKVIFLPLIDPM